MHKLQSVPLLAGRFPGTALWDDERQTFAALLEVFPPTASAYPPSVVRHGVRTADFVTTDALANHLIAAGLAPNEESLLALCDLGQATVERVGDAECIGLTDPDGTRRLVLRTPGALLLDINPRLSHVDHACSWGDAGPATVETARLLCEVAWVRAPALDLDAFALALTYEFLANTGPRFSVGCTSLCDWFLTDAPLTTTLTETDLDRIHHRLVGSGAVVADGNTSPTTVTIEV